MPQSVDLEPAEWQQVISALAMTNPVLVKISTQLAGHRPGGIDPSAMDIRGKPVGNSHKETSP